LPQRPEKKAEDKKRNEDRKEGGGVNPSTF
jgi:hypothetical protein